MKKTFRIPCDCGQGLQVTPQQAGEELSCACGKILEIPTLRLLKRFPIASEEVLDRSANWSAIQGLLFNLGLILCLLSGLIIGYGLYSRSFLMLDKPNIDLKKFTQDLNSVTPTRAWEEWLIVRGVSLEERQTPGYVTARKIATLIWKWNVGAAVAAALGLGMIVGAFLLRSPKRVLD